MIHHNSPRKGGVPFALRCERELARLRERLYREPRTVRTVNAFALIAPRYIRLRSLRDPSTRSGRTLGVSGGKSNHAGFALIEALIAIALVGLVLVSIFGLQNAVFERTTYHAQRLQRMMMVANVLTNPDENQKIKEKKGKKKLKEEVKTFKVTYQVAKPPTTITFQIAGLKNKKFETLKNVRIFMCSFTWEGMRGQEKDAIVGFIYQPPKAKKQKEDEQ